MFNLYEVKYWRYNYQTHKVWSSIQGPDVRVAQVVIPPGGDPDPPAWLMVLHVKSLWLSPIERSLSCPHSLSQIDSAISMAPVIAKCLFFAAFLQAYSFIALQAWQFPLQLVTEPELGTFVFVYPD